MKILVDQDGVIADLEKGFLNNFIEKYPKEKYIPLEKRNTFLLIDQYPKNLRSAIDDIFTSPGFYRNLPIIPGSLNALLEMEKLGNEVFICTSPLKEYENCVLEKYQWVEKNLGKSWTNKIIIIRDKTMIKGDILIDDKPSIKGIESPSWEHIIFNRYYNQGYNYNKRITWKNWKDIINKSPQTL